MDFKNKINQKRQSLKDSTQKELERQQLLTTIAAGNKKVSDTVKQSKPSDKVSVANMPSIASPADIAVVSEGINKLIISSGSSSVETVKALTSLATIMNKAVENIAGLPKEYDNTAVVAELSKAVQAFNLLPNKLPKPESLKPVLEALQSLTSTIDSKEYKPSIKVDSPKVDVTVPEIDISGIEEAIKALPSAISETTEPVDLTPLITAMESVKSSINSLEFPVPNYVIPFKDSDGKGTQVQLTADGKVPVEGGGGGSTSTASLDNDNSTKTPLVDGATFTGEWTQANGQPSIAVFAIANQQLTDYRIEWSNDGVSINTDLLATTNLATTEVVDTGFYIYYSIISTAVDNYYRITATNASGADATITGIYTWVYPEGFAGVYIGLNEALSDFSRGLLTRSVVAGQDPDGALTNQVTSGQVSNLSTSTPLLANTQFEPTEFFDMNGYTSVKLSIVADQAYDTTYYTDTAGRQGGILVEISNDGTNVSTDFIVRTTSNPPVEFLEFSPYFRYFRIKYANGATDQGSFSIGVEATTTPAVAPVSSVGSTLTEDSLALGVKSVAFGQQPDGDFVPTPSDGGAFDNSTPLSPSGTYTSVWNDTDGYKEIELYIATDQVSLSQGVVVEYTNDAQAATPTVYAGPKFTFSADNVAAGFMIRRIPTALDGFRVKYTNGGTLQGSFFISATLKNGASSLVQGSLVDDLTNSQQAVNTRAGIFARNASGTIANIERGTSGGLDIGIVQHEVETPIKSLPTIKVSRRSLNSSTATELTSSSPMAGRRSVAIKAVASGSAVVYIGHNSSVTSSTGYPLSNDQSIDLEVDDTTPLWGITSSGTQAVSVFEIGV